jgi:TonB-linked SusC/RagA family outer membrane protein
MIQKVLKLFLVFCLLTYASIQAQTVTGTITDAVDGTPLPGVNVIIKGTTTGVSTDFDGNYSIDVNSDAAVLQFSFLGYANQEIAVSGKSIINVAMVQSAESLDEVVVTALGIRREKKSLGYAIQEIQGDEMVEARENNIANAFAGKVSGLQVIRGSNGPASSSKIILRGSSSLSGDNQPLIVVDGVPLNNFTGASNNDFWNPSTDLGNGLSDIDPETIASISVLKGASAAALYGSRAGNGVILITTKRGKTQDGLGINYSMTAGFDTVFATADFQNSYGQGSNGIYDVLSGSSWGPKIEGQTVTDWEGKQVQMKAYDNVGNYHDTGVSVNHSISFQQQVSEGSSVYSSLSYLDDDSKLPGAELKRLNLSTRATTSFGPNKSWTSDFKVNYIKATANNRPFGGQNGSSSSVVNSFPRSLDISQFKAGADEFGSMIWYNESGTNPYWSAKNALSEDSRDRFLMTGSVKKELTEWLTAEIKAGADMYTTNSEGKTYAGGRNNTPNGAYSAGKNTFAETNYSALITAAKDNVFGKFGGSVTLGGNLMYAKSSSINASSGELEVPNLFSLNAGFNKPSVSSGFNERKINSVYGTFQLNYDGYWFLDITGRNDWSSTLRKDNRSFFYPSVSTSLVVTDLLKKSDIDLPEWFNYGKIRASHAQVGNSLGAYQLYNSYWIGHDPNGNTTAGRNGTLFNDGLKSELIKSTEFGIETKFFANRISLDFAWYKSNATNQLITIPLNPLSGYSNKMVNAGDIQNEGIELQLNARVIASKDFNWDLGFNYSKNENSIIKLTDDVTERTLGGFDNVSIKAVAGGGYGDIYGTTFLRVEDETSPYFGQLLLTNAGLPDTSNQSTYLGNQNADALIGITNSFAYKGLSFGISIDGRIGGKIFSGTNYNLQQAGVAAATAPNGNREDFIVEGVVNTGTNDAPVYETNTTAVSQQIYWGAIARGNLGITEANLYDATNIRIRSIQVKYAIPAKLIDNSFIKRASLGFSMNNVAMITNHLNGVDPESVYAISSNATGFENASPPSSRTYFLNLSVNF